MTRGNLRNRLARLEGAEPPGTASFWDWLCGACEAGDRDAAGRGMLAELERIRNQPPRACPYETRIAAEALPNGLKKPTNEETNRDNGSGPDGAGGATRL